MTATTVTTSTLTRTVSTITKITTTTMTTTTPKPQELVVGTLELRVDGNVDEFVQSPQVKLGVEQGIAEVADVPAVWVFATLSKAFRRLKEQLGPIGQKRRLQQGGTVFVSYTIRIPTTGAGSVSGASVVGRISPTLASGFSTAIQSKVRYTVDVTFVSTSSIVVVPGGGTTTRRSIISPTPQSSGAVDTDSGVPVVMVVAIVVAFVAFVACVAFVAFVAFSRRLSGNGGGSRVRAT